MTSGITTFHIRIPHDLGVRNLAMCHDYSKARSAKQHIAIYLISSVTLE